MEYYFYAPREPGTDPEVRKNGIPPPFLGIFCGVDSFWHCSPSERAYAQPAKGQSGIFKKSYFRTVAAKEMSNIKVNTNGIFPDVFCLSFRQGYQKKGSGDQRQLTARTILKTYSICEVAKYPRLSL